MLENVLCVIVGGPAHAVEFFFGLHFPAFLAQPVLHMLGFPLTDANTAAMKPVHAKVASDVKSIKEGF